MESIKDLLNKKTEAEKMQKCVYCGKDYVWFERELFSGENKRTLRIQVPSCKCQELREKELERQRILRHKSERLAKLFDNSMMTPFFKEKTFESLTETLEVFKCKEYCKTFSPKSSSGISMIGAVGTGKTTLLAGICNELINNGYSCLFTTLSSLLDKFSSYAYDNAGNITPLLNWLTSFDFVVLDDLGRETYTEKRKEIAFRIIDALLNNKVVVGYTANPEMIVKLKKIPEWNATLDRLKEICKISFKFEGNSLRGREVNTDAINQASL